MGAVYRAEDLRLGSAVALKQTFFSEDEELMRLAFEREARLLANLKHPALPRVYDHFTEGPGAFLIMDLIEGQDLLAHLRGENRRLTAGEMTTWAERLLDALDYLHGQSPPVIHRDIKPQNLKLTPRGELYLLDFGLAKGRPPEASQLATALAEGRSVYGYTPYFAPPEQIEDRGSDARSDLYSLAATFYYLLTGVLPHDATVRRSYLENQQPDPLRPPHELAAGLPVGLSDWLFRALEIERDRRPASAAQMRAELYALRRRSGADDEASTLSREVKRPGDLILNRYVVEEVTEGPILAYRVHDRHDPARKFVAKRVHPAHVRRREVLNRFSREVSVWPQVSGHRHIVRLINPTVLDDDGVSYLFIEHVEGKRLSEVLRLTPGNRLSYPQALRWGAQIASAMEFASTREKNGHGVFVHRALLSPHVLVSLQCLAKVGEWGHAARLLDADDSPLAAWPENAPEGEAAFDPAAPPELLARRGSAPYGVTGDVYYFGALMFEMLLGRPLNPFGEDTITPAPEAAMRARFERYLSAEALPALRAAATDAGLAELVAACLAFDAGERPADFTHVLRGLVAASRRLKSGHIDGAFAACHHCSFIASGEPVVCPVCARTHQFERWHPSSFELPAGQEPAPEAEPPRGAKGAPPAPTPQARQGLVPIPAGAVTLGARHDVLARLAQARDLSASRLEQWTQPAPQRVTLPSFLLSRCAVSNEEYAEFLAATNHTPPANWPGGGRLNSDFKELPVVSVSFADAETFCQWKRVRLPTNDEWEAAARGPEGRAYPWGDAWEARGHGARGAEPAGFYAHTLERHEATRQELLPAHAMPEGATPEGVLQMGGNIWEWVDGGDSGRKHTRGGSWRCEGEFYSLAWFRLPTAPEVTDDDVGFRYAADDPQRPAPPPPTPPQLASTARVEAGTFHLGVNASQLVEVASRFDLPPRELQKLARNQARDVRLEAFEIRRHLVTNEEYYQFVRETNFTWPRHWSRQLLTWSDRPFLDKYRHHPVNHVSFKDAVAFCTWRGGRLPTNDEWEAAARGQNGPIYPWGDEFEPDRANFSEYGLARTTRVGECARGVSPTGCFDLAGNVSEWTSPDETGAHYVRGGSYQEGGGLYGLTFLGIRADPELVLPDVGFRYVLRRGGANYAT